MSPSLAGLIQDLLVHIHSCGMIHLNRVRHNECHMMLLLVISYSFLLFVVGTGPVLSLSNINSSVGGTYYCTVINEAGIGVESVDLFVTPKIITHPVGIAANTFDIVPALTCMAQSFPDSEYRWEKRETFGNEYFEIPDSEGASFNYADSLLSFIDSGYYRCIAYTNVSGIINETASDPAVITGNILLCLFFLPLFCPIISVCAPLFY